MPKLSDTAQSGWPFYIFVEFDLKFMCPNHVKENW